ncbi:hypothetical protein [Streptomyces somaliensis]|uniref:hypothetical protein n=1 Tax=Streptomyces somaliensis TaxID=78355 RepID=UPI00029AA43E|nr:hypothetical protein [Streptomyces somaliensis]
MTPGPAPRDPRGDAGDGRPDADPPGTRPLGPLLRECPPPYRRTSGRLAAVLLYRNGGHRVMWPDRKEDHNTPLFGGPYTVFEVLLGRNVTEFDLELPAAGDGVSFRAKASVQWEVDDPHLVVTRQVWDVAELLRDDLLDGLRAVSRRFGITEAQRADEAVRDELAAGRLHFGRDLGLRTRVLVFFDLDSDVKGQLAEADRTLVGMGVDRRVAERERRRDAYDRQLLADRARELQAVLRQGEAAQIAHHMAANPDKQWEIRRQLLAEEREGKADFLAVLHRLIDTGVIERHDLDQMTYQVLEHLRTSSGGVLGGVADRVLDLPRPRSRALTDGGPPAEPVRPPWEDEPAGHRPADPDDDPHRVHEPTSVRSARDRERDRGRDRDAGAPEDPYAPPRADDRDVPPYGSSRSDDRDVPPYTPPASPSAGFDDWDDE